MDYLKAPNIGIAVYNEESCLEKSVVTLNKALNSIKFCGIPKIYICFNGCSDNSKKASYKIRKIINYPLIILSSKKGKLRAHRVIIEAIEDKNPVLFMDADILITKEAIIQVLCYLEKNKGIMAVSGYPYVIKPRTMTAYQKVIFPILNLKRIIPQVEISRYNVKEFHPDSSSEFEKRARIYFHGRFFAIRDKSIYKFPKCESKIVGDDSFLSRVIISEYGKTAIKVIYSAKIYSYPQLSLREYFKSSHRIKKDIETIYKECPEFEKYKKYFYTKMNLKFILFKLPLGWKIISGLHFILRLVDNLLYRRKSKRIELNRIWTYNQKGFY
jgi:hypothetical protein